MPIAPVLQRFVDDELSLAPALAERVLAGTLAWLRDPQARVPSGDRRTPVAPPGLAEALQARAAPYCQRLLETLKAGVRSHLAEVAGSVPPGDPPGPASGGNEVVDSARVTGNTGSMRLTALQLVDESRVETDIEISRAMQVIDNAAEWELRELQTFTSTLVGHVHVSTESNPFRPLLYATALWEAACTVTTVAALRAALLRGSAAVAAGQLKVAWAAACTRLESQGVEPGIYRTVLLAPGSAPERGRASAPVEPGAMARLLVQMPADDASAIPEAAKVSFERALYRFDEMLRHLAPANATAREQSANLVRRLDLHRAALAAAAPATRDRQLLALLGRLFDSVLADPQVPTPFVMLLTRLQASVLRVGRHEPQLTSTPDHPVWRFLNRVGEAGAGYPVPDDPRARALLARCQALVEPLARAPSPDARLYERALADLDAFLKVELDRQVRAARPAAEALQAAERRELLERQLGQRLVEQMASIRTTPLLHRFMTVTWAGVLAESMLRDGEAAASTRGYLKLVDELSWSLQLPDHPQSRQRLSNLLPDLLQRLRDGMALAQLPEADQQQVLAQLLAIHTAALRLAPDGDASVDAAAKIVQQMRDEVLPETGHGRFSESVIDLGTLETVPADLLPEAPPQTKAGTGAAGLQPGDRLRLFIQGRWARVQVLWRSDQGLFVIFAGEQPGSTHSLTLRALERLEAAGLVQPQERLPLVERAVDNVARAAGEAKPPG